MILDQIIKKKKETLELEKKQESIEQLKEKIKKLQPTRTFLENISRKGINIIAEVKKKSPSEGRIIPHIHSGIANQYENSRAAAISVLTDWTHFGGSKKMMEKIKISTTKPILRKDFIIDEYQIYQSRAYGADAILLITSILTDEELERFIKISKNLGMDCLVETHSEEEIKRINNLSIEVNIYGINNRNLKDNKFTTDLKVTEKLIKNIPKGKIIVSESGIKNKEDVLFLYKLGVNAILTGTGILKSNQKVLTNKINELLDLIEPKVILSNLKHI